MAELPEGEDGPVEFACVNGAGIQPVLAVRHSVYRDRWVAQANACELPWQAIGWRMPGAVPPPPPMSEATVSCPGAEPPPIRFAVIRGRHECAAPGCRAQVDLRRLMCKHHWFALPDRLRAAVWRTYRPGQETRGGATKEYVEAVRAAQDYLRGHR